MLKTDKAKIEYITNYLSPQSVFEQSLYNFISIICNILLFFFIDKLIHNFIDHIQAVAH